MLLLVDAGGVISSPRPPRRSGADRLLRTAARYGALEARLRRTIDARTRHVCPGCTRLCCREHYCRASAGNPWYDRVREAVGAAPLAPGDPGGGGLPTGLAEDGCRIRAGRYVFCYTYNCPPVLRTFRDAGARQLFQELSDLLLRPNRLPRGRYLHEIRSLEELTGDDVEVISRGVEEGLARVVELERLLAPHLRPGLWTPDGRRHRPASLPDPETGRLPTEDEGPG